MKKSLLALAVVAAMPAVALAQSSVTVSGNLKLGVASNSLGGAGSGSGAGIMEGSSRFILSGSEDLGGGLKAVFQYDQRIKPDDAGNTAATASTVANNVSNASLANGNTFVGLAGGFGQVIAGRLDLHYGYGIDNHGAGATALQHSSISTLSYIGASPVASTTRSNNVVQYTLPAMGALNINAAYSFSPNGGSVESALGSNRGNAYNLVGTYAAGALSAGASLWSGTGAGAAGARAEQKSTRVFGTYDLGVAKIGLTYDQSALTASGTETKRTAYSIPVTAPLGKGTAMLTYSKADDNKVAGVTAAGTGATMTVVGYEYPLSKRTALGASYSILNNGSAGAYAMFTGAALGNVANGAAGTDYKSLYLGVNHKF